MHFKLILSIAIIFIAGCNYETEVEQETEMVEQVLNDPQMREMVMNEISENSELSFEMLDELFRSEHILNIMLNEPEVSRLIQENLQEDDQEKLEYIRRKTRAILQSNDSIVCLNMKQINVRKGQRVDSLYPETDTATHRNHDHQHDN